MAVGDSVFIDCFTFQPMENSYEESYRLGRFDRFGRW
jgi:hypothetical protein